MTMLKDKVAIITGAAKGIGKSSALLMAENGAKIVVSDLDVDSGKAVVEEIKSNGGEAIFVKSDAGKAEDCKELVDKAVSEFGGLHIAVNNAGIAGPSAPIGEYPVEEWNKVIDVNLNGVFYGMRYQIPAMLKSGGGSIINMASILSAVGFEGAGAYVTAKHGLIGLTQNAALEYTKEGIRTNAIGPGFIRTPLLENNLTEEQLTQIAGMHPIGRLGKPEEIAELVLWLSSEKSSFVSGSYYPVDGGYLSR